jgi:DNA repair exonuclease SbcCD ATPase subunit
MLKRIELWNWESHEHTVVDDLDPGFNLIHGESNAGKTAIIRALKLVAYNKFDPKSVRVGCKTCTVEVETERGVVRVERGKGVNIWTITGYSKPLENVGKKPVPEAQEILGMRMVELGDLEVPVNIMDQAETHFLLRGLGNKDTSGSVRAQVVDEISGLSGIEGLIKEVSLDNHRWGRQIKQLEDRAAELADQLHDEQTLKAEEMLLGTVQKHIEIRDDSNEAVAVLTELMEEHARVAQEAADAREEFDALPDTAKATTLLDGARTAWDKAEAAAALHKTYEVDIVLLTTHRKQAKAIPDVTAAQKAIDTAEAIRGRLEGIEAIVKEHASEIRERDHYQARLDEAEQELVEAKQELADILAEFTVCPLTLQPIGDECIKNIRIPVTDDAEAGRILEQQLGSDPR